MRFVSSRLSTRPPLALLLVLCAFTAACTRAETASPTTATPEASTTTLASTTTTPVPATTTTAATTTTLPPSTTTTTTSTSTTTTTTTTTTSTSTTTTVAPPATTTTSLPPLGGGGESIQAIRPPSNIPAPPLPDGWSSGVVGSTNAGTDIVAVTRLVEGFRKRVMVIGGVHGNEPVSPPSVRALVEAVIPDDIEVWLIPELNPDGVAAGTRWNAAEVDLNRNFGWNWQPSDGGPFVFSEGETQTIGGMINAFEPDLVVWIHQPYGYVSSIGDTDSVFEEAWAAASGLPVRPDVTQHGGGESWTAFVAGRPSILVEIDSWDATPEIVAAHRAGFEAAVAALD